LQPAATFPPNVRHVSLGIVNCIANEHSLASDSESQLEVPRALVILNCPPSLVELAGVVLLIHIVFLNTRDPRVRLCILCNAVDTVEVLHPAPINRHLFQRFINTPRQRLGSFSDVHQKFNGDHLVVRRLVDLVRAPGALVVRSWL
jgi:hypothetical protein